MADDVISYPLVFDPAVLKGIIDDVVTANVAGYVANVGGPLDWAGEGVAQVASVLGSMGTDIGEGIFRAFGRSIAQVPPQDAAYASVTATVTMVDALGHPFPDGTLVDVDDGVGGTLQFRSVGDVVVVAPATATSAGAVQLVATTPGVAGNGLSGTATMVSNLGYVSTVALVGSSSGGVDAEEDAAYLLRLRDRMRLLSDRWVTAADAALFVRTRISGVHRALAIDGLDPSAPGVFTPGHVSVAAIDTAGIAVGSGVKALALADLVAHGTSNAVPHLIDPTVTTIDVTFAAKASSLYDPTDVQTRADAAVAAYLSPAAWGVPPFGDSLGWDPQTTVRYGELYAVLNQVEGLDYVTTLTLRTGAGAFLQQDITLTGDAPLPAAGVITGTVSA